MAQDASNDNAIKTTRIRLIVITSPPVRASEPRERHSEPDGRLPSALAAHSPEPRLGVADRTAVHCGGRPLDGQPHPKVQDVRLDR